MLTIKLFCVSVTVCDQLKQDEDDEEVLQLTAVVIPAFRDDIEIQIAAAKALALILANGNYC